MGNFSPTGKQMAYFAKVSLLWQTLMIGYRIIFVSFEKLFFHLQNGYL